MNVSESPSQVSRSGFFRPWEVNTQQPSCNPPPAIGQLVCANRINARPPKQVRREPSVSNKLTSIKKNKEAKPPKYQYVSMEIRQQREQHLLQMAEAAPASVHIQPVCSAAQDENISEIVNYPIPVDLQSLLVNQSAINSEIVDDPVPCDLSLLLPPSAPRY